MRHFLFYFRPSVPFGFYFRTKAEGGGGSFRATCLVRPLVGRRRGCLLFFVGEVTDRTGLPTRTHPKKERE